MNSLLSSVRDLGFGLILALLLSLPVAGTANAATDLNPIGTNAPLDGSGTYVLNPGDYYIPAGSPINILPSNHFKIDNAASSLTVTGGTGVLFKLRDFTLGSGVVTVTGGSGIGAYGIHADGGTFSHIGSGLLTATGGNGGNANAIDTKYFIHSGSGVITATGGSGINARGIYTGDTFTHSGSGLITATGGSGTRAYGIYTGATFTHSGSGTITATGGSGNDAHGLYANNNFIHSGSGTITATGGSGNNAHGIYAFNTFTHSGSGALTAIGGTGPGAYGLYAGTTMSIDGILNTARTGAAASVYVNNFGNVPTPLSFGSKAILSPTVDLSGASPSGLVQVRTGNVDIAPGAQLKPILKNTSALALGAKVDTVFMTADNGGFIGDFAAPNTATLAFSLSKAAAGAGHDYVLGTTRFMTPAQAVGVYGTGNAGRLFSGLASGLAFAGGPTADFLNALYWGVDNLQAHEVRGYSSAATRGLTPHDATRLPFLMQRQADAIRTDFEAQLGALALPDQAQDDQTASGIVGASAGNASQAEGSPWRTWIKPIYQVSSRYEAGGPEFSNAKESFGGLGLGLARDFGPLLLGAEAYYLRGNTNSSTADIDSDTWGLLIGGRLHRLTTPGSLFNPVIDFSAGYAYSSFDQKRRDLVNYNNTSSPGAHLVQAGLALGNRFEFGGRAALTPKIGVDYMHVWRNAYTESSNNPASLALRVDRCEYDSLRLKAGLEFEALITQKLSLTGRAYYRFETLDRNVNMRYAFTGAPTVSGRIAGYRHDPSSVDFGLGLSYRATDNFSMSVGYTMILQDKYQGSQINAMLEWRF